MNTTLIKWLAAIIMAMVFATSFAEEFSGKSQEKFVGKWDNNAGIISFFIKDVEGKKQARMLAADEHAEVKLPFEMFEPDLEDLEDLVEDTLKQLGNPDAVPIPPLGTKEAVTVMGNLIYPTGKIRISIIAPAGTTEYVSMVVAAKDKSGQCVYWMSREDLKALKKLLDKVLYKLSES
jgi:hypothetical protein